MNKKSKSAKVSDKNSLMPGLSKAEKSKRAKYLFGRINNLFDSITDWTDPEDFSLKRKTISVDGEKLPELKILTGKKNVAALTPSGLYAFGVNCRIDIISDKENYILFDIAAGSSGADWQLISSDAGKKPKKLTKMIFRNLLKRLKE